MPGRRGKRTRVPTKAIWTAEEVQVLAGMAWNPDDEWSGVIIQPAFGLDFASRGPATVRLQVDWPLITLSGPIILTPQLSVGIVFRPR